MKGFPHPPSRRCRVGGCGAPTEGAVCDSPARIHKRCRQKQLGSPAFHGFASTSCSVYLLRDIVLRHKHPFIMQYTRVFASQHQVANLQKYVTKEYFWQKKCGVVWVRCSTNADQATTRMQSMSAESHWFQKRVMLSHMLKRALLHYFGYVIPGTLILHYAPSFPKKWMASDLDFKYNISTAQYCVNLPDAMLYYCLQFAYSMSTFRTV